MARASSSVLVFIRQNPRTPQNPNSQIRNLALGTREGGHGGEEIKQNPNHEPSHNAHNDFTEIAKEVSTITRTKPRWEQTLLSDFPSFNFSDPRFFNELMKHQNNVLLSLRFFHWLCSRNGFSPDSVSLTALFDALVEAKACSAAKSFLDYTGFQPTAASFECYLRCLFEVGLVEEALDVFDRLRGDGIFPSTTTWNSALSGSLKVGRIDLVWKLYSEMMVSSVVANVDVETVGYLIRAFCEENNVSKGYGLLRQVLEDGLDPGKAAFNKLISGFCKQRQYARVSELLHTMIAKNNAPNIFTYQEVINGLCKRGKQLEGFRVFNDLKERGYAPDRVMYTKMIHGLCQMRWLGDARKLWFEMIQKGFIPNEYTYSVLIYGLCKIGNLEGARKLYKEMCDRGYRETTVSYNMMISWLCVNGRVNEAHELFEEMPQKGVVRDVSTYNNLIRGFCREGKTVEGKNLLKKLLVQGLQPSTPSFTPIIRNLCQGGDIEEAKKLWNDMQNWGLIPFVCSRNHIITGLCEQGFIEEGMEWLLEMMQNKVKPKKKTFETLVRCLSQRDRSDDTLLVLEIMFSIGYTLKRGVCQTVVKKLCKENSHFVEMHLGEILERV
ncbi:hypothetical protein CJ030_MR5G027228 [Morella rubra]|uniref:Pentacotripeptide-repeat region of PRORP domain-containing protein n=1 Tax=Morella rubra TaxID=262757 RepID=A0A6A1VQF6_9ROSI|nr:hypothetical protein CJ030_MR5G027228 [Morella rubra]